MGQGKTPIFDQCRKFCRIRNEYVREAIAELLGTIILLVFVVGGDIQQTLNNSQSPITTVLATTFGIMIAVTITGGASGAHINPAVTLGMAISGYTSWFKVPLYWLMQFLGAYIGAGIAYGIYEVQLDLREDDVGSKVKPYFFAPVPHVQGTTIGTGLLDQVLGTGLLMAMILACIDKRNMQIPKGLIGPYIGLTVGTIVNSLGYNAGATLNPARDLSPRLMALTVGYEAEDIMQVVNYKGTRQEWWLVGLFGPIIGAIVGSLMYILFIGAHLDETEEEMERMVSQGGGGGGQRLSRIQSQGPTITTSPDDWRNNMYIPKAHEKDPRFGSPPPIQAYNNGAYARDDNMSLKRQVY